MSVQTWATPGQYTQRRHRAQTSRGGGTTSLNSYMTLSTKTIVALFLSAEVKRPIFSKSTKARCPFSSTVLNVRNASFLIVVRRFVIALTPTFARALSLLKGTFEFKSVGSESKIAMLIGCGVVCCEFSPLALRITIAQPSSILSVDALYGPCPTSPHCRSLRISLRLPSLSRRRRVREASFQVEEGSHLGWFGTGRRKPLALEVLPWTLLTLASEVQVNFRKRLGETLSVSRRP